ncbi:MAG: very short patch repair endonuclease [Hyphomicrobiales bacterium]|nr:very short patch repair endonuclease [Hyphomicrobiales bacterium]
MDHVDPKRRSEIMAAIRGKDTGPELIVRRYLHRRGFRFRLHSKRLLGKPDLVFSGRRTVVFVHGCFWHSCPHCRTGRRKVKSNGDYWEHKLARNRVRDARTRTVLTAEGWKVLVVWACQTADPALLEQLAEEIAVQSSSGSSPFTASSDGPA